MKKDEFRILIADDDAIVRDVIAQFLAGEGYTATVAKDGLEAIHCLRRGDIKLVLTDLRMRGADGMEVLRSAVDLNPGTFVVLLTAYGTLDTALEAMKEGAYDYIVKPFVMQQLLLVVRNAFKMGSLMHENHKLSDQLREMYRKYEASQPPGGHEGEDTGHNELSMIDTLKERNVINMDESEVLKGRVLSPDAPDTIKKYSDLIKNLKSG